MRTIIFRRFGSKKIVTEVIQLAPDTTFFVAEQFHQNYAARNPKAKYVLFVVNPKLKKIGHEKYLAYETSPRALEAAG